MKDPFYREYSDGTTFNYKTYLASCAAGAVLAVVVVPAVIKWQDSWYAREELKKKFKNKFKKS